MITYENYITANGKYKERLKNQELTQEVKDNALKLLKKVNDLLAELGITDVKVSSGFRPSSVNASTPGSAKKSLHMECKAVDLIDDGMQSLGKLILSKPELLEKHGLWLEDLGYTKGRNTNWVHLDMGNRSARKVRVFKP